MHRPLSAAAVLAFALPLASQDADIHWYLEQKLDAAAPGDRLPVENGQVVTD